MLSNRLALLGLAALCITAAGAGSYLAVRQNANAPESTLIAAAAPGTNTQTADPAAALEAPTSSVSARPTPAPVTARESIAQKTAAPPPRTAPVPATVAPAYDTRPAAPPTVAAPVVDAVPGPEIIETPSVRQDEPRAVEPAPMPEPPVRRAEELVVSADSVLGLKLETGVSSDKAKVEDRVEARVARDVRVSGTVVIPAGSRVVGSVMLVERGGRMKDRARLGIRFHTLYLADGTQIPISTETLYRDGDARGNASAAKIGGGAAAGAILGAIIGGAKGAAIGGGVGAGAGTAAVMTGDPSVASFRPGTEITARILSSIPITVER